jgi:hypothetical protein
MAKKLHIINTAISDTYYLAVHMETDKQNDDTIESFSVNQVSIIETVLSGTPYLNLKFTDGHGDLISQKPIIPDKTFHVAFGTRQKDSIVSKFKLSQFSAQSMNSESMSDIFISGNFISDKWENLFKKTYSRSWSKVRYSDVVRDIATQAGFEKLDIEETGDLYEVIQPNWTNNHFLKWLCKRSLNQKGIGGYFYAIRLDGTFIFKTFDSCFEQKPKKSFNYHTKGDPNGFNSFTMNTSYMPTLVHGGFGLKTLHFDYNTKSFTSDNITLDTFNERQLSDWYYVAKSHMEPSKLLYGGRDTDLLDVAQNQIITNSNSVHKTEIQVVGDQKLQLGDIINLRIPNSGAKQQQDTLLNEMYSGYWFIWKVAHLIDGNNRKYITHLFLMRNGINGLNVKGLVKTSTGKDIK